MIDLNKNEIIKSFIDIVQYELSKENLDYKALKESLINLLQYLSSPEGRTDENCRYIDYFFQNNDVWVDSDLPERLHDIFADMSGALHDTVSAPQIAYNFYSTPEQLLERVKKIIV